MLKFPESYRIKQGQEHQYGVLVCIPTDDLNFGINLGEVYFGKPCQEELPFAIL